MISSSKAATLARNQNMVINAPLQQTSSSLNGILISKDETVSKNKTFNYPKESSTTRGEHFIAIGLDQRRQRSSKVPTIGTTENQRQMQLLDGQSSGKTQHHSANGHFTPQLMMTSQSES